MSNEFYVYVHSRLKNGEPFYVGKGRRSRVLTRFGRSEHWKQTVSKDGGRYVNIVIKTADEELAFLVESELIDRYRRLGADLINKTNGGEGMSGYRMTPEQIANQSRAKMGNKNNLGRKDSEETRARKRAAQQARSVWPKHAEETKKKIGLKSIGNKYNLGHKASVETRAKLSAFHKGKQHTLGHSPSPEHRAKLAAIHKNRPQHERDEISRKLSIAITAVWARRKEQQAVAVQDATGVSSTVERK